MTPSRRGPVPVRPLPRTLLLVLLALNLLLGVLLWVAGGPGWTLADALARRRMVNAIGPGAWQVHVTLTSFPDLLVGRLGRLELSGDDVRLHDGLAVAHLSAVLQNVAVAGDMLVRLDAASFSVRVTEAELNEYLGAKSGGMLRPVPAIRLLSDEVDATARDRFLGLGLPLHVRGQLQVRDQTRLFFVLDRARLGSLDLPRRPLHLMLEILQRVPIVDLRDLPFGLRIQRFEVHPGRIDISGTAAPPLPLPLKTAESPAR